MLREVLFLFQHRSPVRNGYDKRSPYKHRLGKRGSRPEKRKQAEDVGHATIRRHDLLPAQHFVTAIALFHSRSKLIFKAISR